MILGTSHIAISTYDIESDIKTYIEKGFSLQFLEKNLPNSRFKEPFLSTHTPLHSLAVLNGKSGIDLELVQHHTSIPDSIKTKDHYLRPEIDNGSVMELEYDAYQFEESITFLNNLAGFSLVEESDTFKLLEMRSLIPKWRSRIRVIKSDQKLNPALDQPGATCIAFLTSNLNKELNRLGEKGYHKSSPAFLMEVNDKELKIAFIRGPSNEIIELIEINHGK